MRRVFLKLCVFFFCLGEIFAQSKPLYQLPDISPDKKNAGKNEPFLVGTDNGIYRVDDKGNVEALWTEGKVSQMTRAGNRWFFVTEKGIIASDDLVTFTEKNNGLTFLTVKRFDGTNKTLEQKAQLLKDFAFDPLDPNIIVTATKDAVFLSRDAGENWKSIGSMSTRTAGMKAVAVSHMPVYDANGAVTGSEVVVFMSHPILGFSYYRADAKKPGWIDVSAGFTAMPSLTQADELADIVPVVCKGEDGKLYAELYISQSFLPNIFRFNWKTKRAEKVYAGKEKADSIDGLCQSNDKLVFSTIGNILYYSLSDGTVSELPQPQFDKWRKLANEPHALINCASVPSSFSGLETRINVCELWMLKPNFVLTPWGSKAAKQKSIYVSAYQMRNMDGINKYRKIIKDNRLNSLVIDMKDDYGYLRFEPNSPLLKKKGKVTGYKIDADNFVSEFKKDGIYLIARIVVFKDKNLAAYDKKQYAVWDSKLQAPWVGIRGTKDVLDEEGNPTGEKTTEYYDENWVDPYSEEVWEYNVEIAKELVSRGFDEIQFDYIRFPTDGENLGRAYYRWRDKGMDKESALMSFLAYARQNINAPIGIDIYGANGWYRSGTRTGQDVELMSEYVDVICPMYYPSHFEQNFMEYAPVAERPYRIYFYGSYRNTVIGRNRIVVRPWVQAFYMGVRYDKRWYDKDYVRREIFGVRDGVDRGYMYWNNSGGYYEDISPDPLDEEISPWAQDECKLQTRIPAFSSDEPAPKEISEEELSMRKNKSEAMLSVLDTVLNQGRDEESNSAITRLPNLMLHIEPFGKTGE